ncbi:isocitrate/isopropylmalate dehydrogenase family protein [Paraburkholderia sp.]|jgi:3-isopropylmalate dehydrogenase|uniref:isocitrate/isopropylmalate dehydrogenase family protein n=1 Tax=Paraburkholderia sp. TaxID=1926495 RepID=UPI000F47359C|nr:isocitrate/isopropylmalate dehydrogenase family protein [Paraburkholderia sp.]
MKIGILEGDDIGHEVVPETVKVMRAAAEVAGLEIDWHPVPIGRKAYDTLGYTLPPGTLERLEALDGWVLGPIGHMAYPKVPEAVNPHPILRKHFDLFANIRPSLSYAGIESLHQNVDLVIVRENNEGFQPDRNVVAGCGEFRPTHDVTISVRVITRAGSSKVLHEAFKLARSRRKQVTVVHKDTVFKLGCGMFVEEAKRIAAEYPDVVMNEAIVDTFAMRLVMTPQKYDVVVTTNMFGDILSDEAAGLVGGLGLAPGLSAGPRHAMAQATHGSAPDIAGRGIANPYAMVMSGQMLLDWLGRKHDVAKASEAAVLIEKAVSTVMREKRSLTADLGGTSKTHEMGDAIVQAIGQN